MSQVGWFGSFFLDLTTLPAESLLAGPATLKAGSEGDLASSRFELSAQTHKRTNALWTASLYRASGRLWWSGGGWLPEKLTGLNEHARSLKRLSANLLMTFKWGSFWLRPHETSKSPPRYVMFTPKSFSLTCSPMNLSHGPQLLTNRFSMSTPCVYFCTVGHHWLGS